MNEKYLELCEKIYDKSFLNNFKEIEPLERKSSKIKILSDEERDNAEELISALKELNSDDNLSLEILSKLEKIIK